jgi:hypothetical protein
VIADACALPRRDILKELNDRNPSDVRALDERGVRRFEVLCEAWAKIAEEDDHLALRLARGGASAGAFFARLGRGTDDGTLGADIQSAALSHVARWITEGVQSCAIAAAPFPSMRLQASAGLRHHIR